MKNVNIKLLTLMTSVIFMMSAGPAAFGQATPATHAGDVFLEGGSPGAPNTPAQVQSVNTPSGILVIGQTPDIVLTKVWMGFSTAGVFPTQVPFAVNAPEPDATVPILTKTCSTVGPDSSVGEIMWVLFHSSGVAVTAKHLNIATIGFNPSTLWFDSTGTVSPPATLNPLAAAGDGFGSGGTATVGITAPGSIILPVQGAGSYWWGKVAADGITVIDGAPGAGADTTGLGGTYTVGICAYIDGNNDGDWGGFSQGGTNPATEQANNIYGTFDILITIGGEKIPISNTSLLVAGSEANAFWILPILGLAGTIIAIRKLEA